MSTIRDNSENQALDIGGSYVQDDNMILEDERYGLGRILNSGSGSSIIVGATVSLNGLTGMTPESEGRYIELEGFVNSSNDGYFLISSYVSPSEVQIVNTAAISEVINFSFNERQPYSLEDDINYIRTDRSNIKGVPYYEDVSTYVRPNDLSTQISTNLENISGNTTDAIPVVVNREYYNQVVNISDAFITINDAGNLKHSDSNNILGVPVIDGYDSLNEISTFSIIVDSSDDGYGTELIVLNGPNVGNRIFGRTRAGSSTSPNSVEVEFMSVPPGAELSEAVPYIWESGQSLSINIIIGVRKTLSSMEDVDFRRLMISGIIFGGGSSGSSGSSGDSNVSATQVGQVLYSIDGSTFQRSLPMTSKHGWIVNEQGILIVV